MKTNRRGFFGALAGLAGGAYAAFVPSKKKVWGKDPKDFQIECGVKAYDIEHGQPPKIVWDLETENDITPAKKGILAKIDLGYEGYIARAGPGMMIIELVIELEDTSQKLSDLINDNLGLKCKITFEGKQNENSP